ncbi:Uncharacterised protein [Vibrio cholerae]|uniref:Fimbrial protein n=2 Tax=Vibrio cholerae TaxID=666 RepID=A0A655X6V9_VIBCL|nr:Uncharacterised protein [Vibrio cholerae]
MMNPILNTQITMEFDHVLGTYYVQKAQRDNFVSSTLSIADLGNYNYSHIATVLTGLVNSPWEGLTPQGYSPCFIGFDMNSIVSFQLTNQNGHTVRAHLRVHGGDMPFAQDPNYLFNSKYGNVIASTKGLTTSSDYLSHSVLLSNGVAMSRMVCRGASGSGWKIDGAKLGLIYEIDIEDKVLQSGQYKFKGSLNIPGYTLFSFEPTVIDTNIKILVPGVVQAESPVNELNLNFTHGQNKITERVPIFITSNDTEIQVSMKCMAGKEYGEAGCLLTDNHNNENLLLSVNMDGKSLNNNMGTGQSISLDGFYLATKNLKYVEIVISDTHIGQSLPPGHYSGSVVSVFEAGV